MIIGAVILVGVFFTGSAAINTTLSWEVPPFSCIGLISFIL